MTKQEAIQQQIDDIMDTFNFEDVEAWMKHDGWVWGSPNHAEAQIPGIYQLRSAARERLKDASKSGFSSTGGFTAVREEGEDDSGPWIRLNLFFGYQSLNDGTSYAK